MIKFKQLVVLALGLSLLFLQVCYAVVLGRQIEIAPQGDYARINVKNSNLMMHRLNSTSYLTRGQAMHETLSHPGQYIPPVLCVLSKELADDGQMDNARFWYYACMLRAMSDGNKTTDPSSRAAVFDLAPFAIPFSKEIVNQETIQATINKVIAWDKKTPRKYDPRWLMLHGTGAFFEKHFSFAPKSHMKKRYSGLTGMELRELKQLQEENRQLKKLVADLSLDKQMLQDVLSKKA